MSLPNLFGPKDNDQNKTIQKLANLTKADLDAMTDKEVTALLGEVTGTGLAAPVAMMMIVDSTAMLFSLPSYGPAKTIEFLEGLIKRLRGHSPGHTCPHCDKHTPKDDAA